MRKPFSSTVSVAGGRGPYRNVADALRGLDLSPIRGKSVLIKPNAGRKVPPGMGITAHPQAVEAVIDLMLEKGASKVAVGESPILGVKTMEAFESTGIGAIARKKGVPLIDMDARKPVIREVRNGRVLDTLRFCADIYDFDMIVSVPVAKAHMHTQVSLGIKNMKGCLWRKEKVRLHQLQYKKGTSFPEKTLDSAIADMTSLLLPDLTVLDAYVGMEGMGPSSGEQVKSDFALASFNALAADRIGCELMGVDFEAVPHLTLIRDLKIISLEGLAVVPADYLRFRRPFRKPPSKIDIAFPGIVIHDKGACSACLSTVLLFLKRFAREMGDYVLKDGKLHIAMGPDSSGFPEGTLLIGNCTSPNRKKGNFVPGCPPVASRIYKAVTGAEPEDNEPEVR